MNCMAHQNQRSHWFATGASLWLVRKDNRPTPFDNNDDKNHLSYTCQLDHESNLMGMINWRPAEIAHNCSCDEGGFALCIRKLYYTTIALSWCGCTMMRFVTSYTNVLWATVAHWYIYMLIHAPSACCAIQVYCINIAFYWCGAQWSVWTDDRVRGSHSIQSIITTKSMYRVASAMMSPIRIERMNFLHCYLYANGEAVANWVIPSSNGRIQQCSRTLDYFLFIYCFNRSYKQSTYKCHEYVYLYSYNMYIILEHSAQQVSSKRERNMHSPCNMRTMRFYAVVRSRHKRIKPGGARQLAVAICFFQSLLSLIFFTIANTKNHFDTKIRSCIFSNFSYAFFFNYMRSWHFERGKAPSIPIYRSNRLRKMNCIAKVQHGKKYKYSNLSHSRLDTAERMLSMSTPREWCDPDQLAVISRTPAQYSISLINFGLVCIGM